MNAKPTPAIAWLQKNQANIKWKLVGPNIQNPFDVAASTERLQEYVYDINLLKENCSVQAYMDDTTIIKITDLNFFEFSSEHPNLNGLAREELQRFLESSGTWKIIQAEIRKVQDSCKAEIAARDSGTQSY